MFKLVEKNKKEYNKLVEKAKARGDSNSIAIHKAIEQLKLDGKIVKKVYTNFVDFIHEDLSYDINNDGVIDNEDIRLALDELEVNTRLEDDLVEYLIVSAENDLIPDDMIDGLFELISDHVDLSDIEDDEKQIEESNVEYSCNIEEIRAKALIKKKGGKRRVRCTSGPNKGRIRVAGTCAKKLNLKLSRKLKRSKKRISSAKKSMSAKRGLRTAKRRGTR